MSKKSETTLQILGIIGFTIEFLSVTFQFSQGESWAVFVLRWLGIFGILFWVIWVTVSIRNIQRETLQKSLSNKENFGIPEEFEIKKIYFDGTNRSFLDDLKIGRGAERKGTDLENASIGRVFEEGKVLRIERFHEQVRLILSVRKYLNTTLARSNDFIPGDTDHDAKGKFIRYIYFEYWGYVQNEPHNIYARIRQANNIWLKVHGNSSEYASHKDRISTKSWDKFSGILGPVRADESCYFSLDIESGPKGNTECLFIKDLKVVEVREHDKT
jgi:hypothetical protein